MFALVKPVHIFVGRRELIGYTDMTLIRDKTDMTGELTITIFMGYMPNEAVLGDIIRGEEILVYIGGRLAFTGIVDRRTDVGEKTETKEDGEGSLNLDIGPDSYTVQIVARGKTKVLVDSAHQSPTTLLNQTNRSAIEKLVEPWGIVIDWDATEIDLGRVRFEDGATVFEEIQRLARSTGLYVFETRSGTLRITDRPLDTDGEAIVLGQNILSFRTDQLGDLERDEIVVKGQRLSPTDYGSQAVLSPLQRVKDQSVKVFSPVVVQIHGDASPEVVERAALYEANQQASLSKQIDVDMFNVQQTDGQPWDLGGIHFVQIPPAGVVGAFEIVKVVYTVDNSRTVKTRLTLAPPPTEASKPDGGLLAGVSMPKLSASPSTAALQVGALAGSWLGASLSAVLDTVETAAKGLLDNVTKAADSTPPEKLPPTFNDGLDD